MSLRVRSFDCKSVDSMEAIRFSGALASSWAVTSSVFSYARREQHAAQTSRARVAPLFYLSPFLTDVRPRASTTSR